MKTTKFFPALLVLLGFSACKPETADPPMYGVKSSAYESKAAVQDVPETVGMTHDEVETVNE